MDLLPDAYPIGRTMPDVQLTGLIHAAAPNYRDEEAVVRFHEFNQQIHGYLAESRLRRIVIVGSWWQTATGNCRNMLYTKLKDHQRRMFPGTHILPYSIFGDEARAGRGFIPQLIQAIQDRKPLQGLSDQPRDFIHVTDVARACIIGLDSPRGTYMAGWGETSSPRDIAAKYGLKAPQWVEYPDAAPTYLMKPVPAWKPLIKLHPHIQASTSHG
jgi:hypothetical protein